MKRSTDDIIKALRLLSWMEKTSDGPECAKLLGEAADRLEQLTMPDDATFARIVDAMSAEFGHAERSLRNMYRAAVKAVES